MKTFSFSWDPSFFGQSFFAWFELLHKKQTFDSYGQFLKWWPDSPHFVQLFSTSMSLLFCPLYHTEIVNSLFSFSIVIFPGMASYKFVMNRCHVPFVHCVCLPSTCTISLSALTILPYLYISLHIIFSVNSTGESHNITFVKTLFYPATQYVSKDV